MTLALKEHYLPVVNVIGLGLGKERVSRYDVGAEGTLPPSSKCDTDNKNVLLNLLYFSKKIPNRTICT